ncbi:hypothetical protein BC834DRAFT_872873 [Gloeopeniophorella convolvens]|nr:hypothetical protein BC834DRAFT_872873 [Gloeopeniophorella convolvens]
MTRALLSTAFPGHTQCLGAVHEPSSPRPPLLPTCGRMPEGQRGKSSGAGAEETQGDAKFLQARRSTPAWPRQPSIRSSASAALRAHSHRRTPALPQ